MSIPASALITRPEELASLAHVDPEVLAKIHAVYPLRVSRYFLELALQHGAPLLRQVVPDALELADTATPADPLNEENLSPLPCLIHRYPDRVVLLVSRDCPTFCRFCTRKRKIGTAGMQFTQEMFKAALEYIRKRPAIVDVLISGGDPLMLADEALEQILAQVRAIPGVRFIRIGSRMPCMMPQRITAKLVAMLKRFHPLYMNLHFNHPDELSPEATAACERLANAGIPLGSQTVLLRGVNDSAAILQELFYRLLAARVKPYYLFQIDQVRGTSHFRTTIQSGQAIMRRLIGHVSGMAQPHYALDTPGGGGKIPLCPGYLDNLHEHCTFTTYAGKTGSYPNTLWPKSR